MPTSEELYQRALQYLRTGDNQGAQELLKRVIRDDVHNVNAWMRYAGTLPSHGERIKVLRWCLKHNPDNEMVQSALSRLQREDGEAGEPVREQAPQVMASPPQEIAEPSPVPKASPSEVAVDESPPPAPYPEPPPVASVEAAEEELSADKADGEEKFTAKKALILVGAFIVGTLCCCLSWVFLDLVEAQDFGYVLGPLALIIGASTFYALLTPDKGETEVVEGAPSSPSKEAVVEEVEESAPPSSERAETLSRAELQAAIKANPRDDALWLRWLATFSDPEERKRAIDLWLRVDPDNPTAQTVQEKLNTQR